DLVHEAGEEGVFLVVGDSLLVVDAAVQGDVDAEGQESHAASLSHTVARGSWVGACWKLTCSTTPTACRSRADRTRHASPARSLRRLSRRRCASAFRLRPRASFPWNIARRVADLGRRRASRERFRSRKMRSLRLTLRLR